jgi:hypothetical protein
VSLVEQAVAHGVASLLYRALHELGAWEHVSMEARDALAGIARESLLIECVRAQHLARVIEALAAEGVRPLLFKGAALAATHYPEPWLRTRGDTDLLVRAGEAPRVVRLLESLQFARLPRPDGALVTQQSRCEGSASGVPLAYDVHWRIADPHAFAAALPYDELEPRAVADHPSGARRVSNVDALAIACVHRAAHHYDAGHLLLIYDIQLLATGLTEEQWQAFTSLAAELGLRTVFRRGLELASDTFGLRLPLTAQAALAGGKEEPTGVFVGGGVRRIDVLLSDLRALNGWPARLQLLKSHLFPSSSYLDASAPARSAFPSYLVRALKGARGWWRPL